MTSFTPQNQLETLLMQASSDPGVRPAFYREFLNSDLLVLGKLENVQTDATGRGVAQAGSTVSIAHWQDKSGNPVVPVFSSLPRLQEAIKQHENYVQFNGKALLEMIGSSIPVILNPASSYGKEFLSQELASLIDGTIFRQPESFVVPEDRQVLLGQPANYPHAFVDALRSLFAHHPEVESAYLAWMHDPASDTPPHTVVGIKSSGSIEAILPDVGLVSESTLGPGEFADFVQVREGDTGLSRYMVESTEPFYKRV